jgi:hypothetical protein
LPYFAHPPPFPDEIAFFGRDAQENREDAIELLQTRFLAVTNLLRCMFSASPHSQLIAAGTAEFLQRNHLLITQLLRLRYLSLSGLAMTEAVVALLSMLVGVTPSPLMKAPRGGSAGDALSGMQQKDRARGGGQNIEADVLPFLSSSKAEEILADMSVLLGILGEFFLFLFIVPS